MSHFFQSITLSNNFTLSLQIHCQRSYWIYQDHRQTQKKYKARVHKHASECVRFSCTFSSSAFATHNYKVDFFSSKTSFHLHDGVWHVIEFFRDNIVDGKEVGIFKQIFTDDELWWEIIFQILMQKLATFCLVNIFFFDSQCNAVGKNYKAIPFFSRHLPYLHSLMARHFHSIWFELFELSE